MTTLRIMIEKDQGMFIATVSDEVGVLFATRRTTKEAVLAKAKKDAAVYYDGPDVEFVINDLTGSQ